MSIFVWRIWEIRETPHRYSSRGYVLTGLYGSPWAPNIVKQAVCTRYEFPVGIRKLRAKLHLRTPLEHGNDVPFNGCTCGIYGNKYDTIPPVESPSMLSTAQILGVAEIWGKIIVAEKGYRAQFAKMRALVNASYVVSDDYNVPNLPSVEYAKKEFFFDG